MANKFNKPISFNKTLDMYVKRFYGGNDQGIIEKLKDNIQRVLTGNINQNVINFLSSYTQDKGLINELENTANEMLPIWTDPQNYLQGLLGKNVDLTILTDEELQNRYEILNELSKDTEYLNLGKSEAIYDPNFGITDQKYLPSILTKKGIDTSSDLKIIQDLLNQRQRQAQANQVYEDYLTALPGELSSERNKFLDTQREIGQKRLAQMQDPIKEQLNARGILFGGGYTDYLTQEAVNMQSELEKIQAQLELEDNQLYFNAAYDNQMRKLLETEQNYMDVLSNARQNILQNQQNIFNTKQRELDQEQEIKLQKNSYEQQLKFYQDQINKQNRESEKKRTNELIGGIGASVGAIGGAYLGGPAGAQIGSQVGSIPGNVK